MPTINIFRGILRAIQIQWLSDAGEPILEKHVRYKQRRITRRNAG